MADKTGVGITPSPVPVLRYATAYGLPTPFPRVVRGVAVAESRFNAAVATTIKVGQGWPR